VAAEREVAQGKEGSELSQLRQQLATAIKDNGLLLQRARDAASDADDMEDELDKCKQKSQEEIAQKHAELKAEQVSVHTLLLLLLLSVASYMNFCTSTNCCS
jgi:ribosomal protein L29